VNPFAAEDTGQPEVTGRISDGLDLDNNSATGFTSPDGRKGVDNNLYRAWGCDARSGARVILCEEDFLFGGRLLSENYNIAHIGAIVWQSAPGRFSFAVFRSYAGNIWHWLAASAAEVGLTVEERP
jgi:hypothetical protein